MKSIFLVLFFVLMIFALITLESCDKRDAINSGYEPEWKLSMADYLHVNYSVSGTYFPVGLLDDNRILVSEYHIGGTNLVEIDHQAGAFLDGSAAPGVMQFHKKKDGTLLISTIDPDNYLLGGYDTTTHAVNFTSTVTRDIEDPPSQTFSLLDDNSIYTYESDNGYYVARWDFTATQLWRDDLDHNQQEKIVTLFKDSDDHLLFNAADNITQEWKVGKVAVEGGTLLWHKKLNDLGYIYSISENKNGNIFIFNTSTVSMYSPSGDVVWTHAVHVDNGGTGIFGRTKATMDNGVIFQVYQPDGIYFMKLNEKGEMVWTTKYWEEQSGGIEFLELPNGDLITTSLKGGVTKYHYTK